MSKQEKEKKHQSKLIDELKLYGENALVECMNFYNVYGLRQLSNEQLERYLKKLKNEKV